MMTTDSAALPARPGPRAWRAAVVVFLTVFLAGLGLSGANALWSQSGAVSTQVSTGEWVDYSRAGFSMPLTLSVDDAKGIGLISRSIRLSWTNAAELDPATHQITYRVDAKEIQKLKVYGKSLPYQGSAAEVTFRTSNPWLLAPAEKLRITVTPYVNGVAGTPTVKDLWLDSTSNTWLTDVE